MLSEDTKFRLKHAVANKAIAEEIEARLISSTPANALAAQILLKTLNSTQDMALQIERHLFQGLAGDANGAAGLELAKKINGMIAVVNAKATSVSPSSFKAAMGSEPMSDEAFKCLRHAMANEAAAAEFKAAYNAMIVAVQAIA